jgi:hypothetical protein
VLDELTVMASAAAGRVSTPPCGQTVSSAVSMSAL